MKQGMQPFMESRDVFRSVDTKPHLKTEEVKETKRAEN